MFNMLSTTYEDGWQEHTHKMRMYYLNHILVHNYVGYKSENSASNVHSQSSNPSLLCSTLSLHHQYLKIQEIIDV